MYPYPKPISISSCWCPVKTIGTAGTNNSAKEKINNLTETEEPLRLPFTLFNWAVKKSEKTEKIIKPE